MPPALRLRLALLLSASGLCLPFGALGQVRGLTYTAAPVAAYVNFEPNAGFRDGRFFGGTLGFGFGEFLELSGVYLRDPSVRSDLSGLDAPDSATPSLQGRSGERYRLDRYGATIRLNGGRSALRPFGLAGTGVLRFDPDQAGATGTESIYVQYGLGATYTLADRYALSLSAGQLAYRYSPFATFGFGADLSLQPEDFPLRTVYNTQVQAALRVYLGGRAPGEETEADLALRRGLGGEGVRLLVEPTYGILDFHRRLGASFPDRQPFAGVSAGVDLGPYVGLRGFYLRATQEDEVFDNPTGGFRELALYGGELNFRFAQPRTRGFTPYLIAGAGYLDAGAGYTATGTSGTPTDRYFATGGAGLDVALTRGLRLKAAARSVFMAAEDADNVVLPTRVFGSAAYSAGVAFSLGAGHRAAPVPAVAATRETAALDSLRAESARLRAETARLRDEVDRQRDAYTALYAAESPRQRDSLLALLEARRVLRSDSTFTSRRDTARIISNISNRVLQIPVPEVGEIYIRFGEPGSDVQVETAYAPPIVMTAAPGAVPGMVTPASGLTAEQVRSLVRETIRSELAASGAAGRSLTQADVERAIREALRTQAAQNSDLSTIAQRLSAIEGRLSAPEAGAPTVTAPEKPAPATPRSARFRFANVLPFTGVRWGGGDTQVLVGVRGDFRRDDTSARFEPEVAVGFGDNVSVQVFGNYVRPFDVGFAGPFRPYAGAGVGFTTRSGLDGLGLALNLLAGTEYPIGPGRAFAEFSTLDFFTYNRVLAGYRIVF